MARAIWSGVVGFGLVSIPIRLFAATEDKTVHFHELDAKSGKRIHHRRVAGKSGREVPADEIVKAYEANKGQYVTVTAEELDSVQPGRSRTIEVEDFVDLHEIDPVHFQRTYYLVPDEAGRQAYGLLRAAMERTERVAIARFVLQAKEHLVAIRARDRALVLETMYFPDEVRDPSEFDMPKRSKPPTRELHTAEQLIDSLSRSWDPSRYHDTYREEVLKLIERKAKGEEIVVEEAAEEPAPVTDLMAALEASIDQARQGNGHRRSTSSKRSTRTQRNTRARSNNKLQSLSRDELYERASRRGISGRSKMSKDDLVDALQQAS